MSTQPTTEREFVPPPATNTERNADRWLLTELRRVFKWSSTILTIYGDYKRSRMCATIADCLGAAATVIEGRLKV